MCHGRSIRIYGVLRLVDLAYLRDAAAHPSRYQSIWVSRLEGHLRTQGDEDADVKPLVYIHLGKVDWKLHTYM